jgi:hypothetical protein
MMVAYWRVTEVRVIEGHAVWVRFADDLEGVVRFPPDFFQGVFSHLCAPEKFREVSVVDGAVTWPGGLDIAPDAMYDEVKLQSGQIPGKAATVSTHGCRFDRDAANERR